MLLLAILLAAGDKNDITARTGKRSTLGAAEAELNTRDVINDVRMDQTAAAAAAAAAAGRRQDNNCARRLLLQEHLAARSLTLE